MFRLVILFVAAFVLLLAILPLLLFERQIRFPEPEGSFPVGVISGELADPQRGGAWNAVDDAPRRLLVRLWYPADGVPEGTPRYRNTQAERDANPVMGPSGFNPFALLQRQLFKADTHAYWDVPVAKGSFPLLIFSHGYMGDVSSNAVLMEQLASRGYIVVSITHPGESSAVVFPDGSTQPRSGEAAAMLDGIAGAGIWDIFPADIDTRLDWIAGVIEKLPLYSDRLPIWVDDFRFVLDALMQGQADPAIGDVLARVDFDAVGFLGMSAGAAAAPAACHLEPRCRATAALDVLAGLPYLRNAPIRTPALIFDGGIPNRMGGQDLYYEPHDSFGLATNIYRIDFPLNGHGDFTDAALTLTPLGKWTLSTIFPMHGPVDGTETLLVQSRLIAGFFDIYLKAQPQENFPHGILGQTRVAQNADPAPFREWVRNR